MEHPSDPRYISRDQKCIGAAKRNAPPHTRRGTKLRDILMSDKPDLSSADFHQKLTRDSDDAGSKCLGNQKFRIRGGTPEEDELVRYMSNLPNYLAKGNNFLDKALNFGVLDWKRLEKWQYKQKQMSKKHNDCSPSSSGTTVFSTDGSSTHSSGGQSCSLSHQGMQRPSLESPPELSATEQDIRDVESSLTHQDVNNCWLQSHPLEVYEREWKSHEVLHAQQRSERKQSDSKFASEMEQFPATWKGKTKMVNSEFTKQPLDLTEFKVKDDDRCENRCSGVATSTSTVDQFLKKAEPRSISQENDSKNSLPCQTEDYQQHCEPTGPGSQNRESSKDSFQASHISPRSSKMCHSPSEALPKSSYPVRTITSPSRSRSIEEKPSEGFDRRKISESTLKARNLSPIRRLSFTMGKMVKDAGTRDISPLCRSIPKDRVVKYGPDSVITASDNPYNNRSGTSPLRRLLDPILKSRDRSEPSNRHPSPTIGSMKSCNDSRSRSAGFCDSHHNSKHGSSSLEALLQVSFKNGFPLFTFAIDNESNILAATVRKSFVVGKDHHNWTYTFFTVHEVKRKSGIWLNNHGGKDVGPGYVPNAVAQMKVSDSRESPSTMKDSTDGYITREFDFFAVDVGNGDHYATDFHPTNELAAIVVQLPRISGGDDLKDGQSNYNWLDLSRAFRSPSSSMTVVLPGGVHTGPSKGEISTLAQRWRSGGSCDCGGWDLGCQLRVYTNQRSYNRSEGSYPGQDNCQLFSQGGQENEPMLSLAPFKERIYSVEFNSSLSLLQAFAICISFIDCRRPAEVADPRNAVEKINNELGVFEVPLPIKTSNHQVGAPARYISYPPNSPVGRV